MKNKYKSVLLHGFAAKTLDTASARSETKKLNATGFRTEPFRNDGDFEAFNDFAGD